MEKPPTIFTTIPKPKVFICVTAATWEGTAARVATTERSVYNSPGLSSLY